MADPKSNWRRVEGSVDIVQCGRMYTIYNNKNTEEHSTLCCVYNKKLAS